MRLFLGILAVVAAPAFAEEAGEDLFRSHCAGCHGVSAQGDGPMAALLTVPVPDLTMLAARNGGEFPLVDVVQTIDGRRLFTGHGGPMPVFGPMLGGGSAVVGGPGGTIVETRGDILDIVTYLEGLQR